MRRVALAAALALAAPTARADVNFVAGHYYTSHYGGNVQEWDESLHPIRQFTVPNIFFTDTLTFNSRNNLVMVAQQGFNGPMGVFEIDASGSILRSYNAGMSISGGFYIDYDPQTDRFAVAAEHRVLILDGDLNFVSSTGNDFNRASGVAFGNNTLYTTDQSNNGVRRYTGTNPPVYQGTTPYIAWIPTGLDVAADGNLITTAFGNGRIDRLDPLTGAVTPIVTGLGYGNVTDVKVLPDGNLLAVFTQLQLRLYSPTGQLLSSSPLAPLGQGESVAFFVPAPAAGAALLCVLFAQRRRRRRGR